MACACASSTPARRKATQLGFVCMWFLVWVVVVVVFFKQDQKWGIRRSNPNNKQIPRQINFNSRGFCSSLTGGKNTNLVYFDKDSYSNFLSWIYHYYKYYSQFSYFHIFFIGPAYS